MKNYFSLIKIAAPAIYSDKFFPKSRNVRLDIAKKFFYFLQRFENAPKGKLDNKKRKPREDGDEQQRETLEIFKTKYGNGAPCRFFFHGTNSKAYGKIADSKLMRSPEWANAWQGEARPATQNVLYYSQSLATASGYANSRTTAIPDTFAVTLVNKIPLYAIAEVRSAIFRPYMPTEVYPNESNSHHALSDILQPEFSRIGEMIDKAKTSKEKKEIINKSFESLIEKLDSFFESNYGEFTIAHGMPLRFTKDIYFPRPILGCRTASELNETLEKSEVKRNDFLKLVSKAPSLFSLLTPEQQSYKVAQKVAGESWYKLLSQDIDNVKWIPSLFLNPTKDKEMQFGPKKQTIHAYLERELLPKIIEKGENSTDSHEFKNWVYGLPKILHANLRIAPIIKKKILEFGPLDPDNISQLCGYLSINFWSDEIFLDDLIEKVWSKASMGKIKNLWSADYNTRRKDNFPLLNKIGLHPKALKFYFSKTHIDDVFWHKFPEESLKSIENDLKEKVNKSLSNADLETCIAALKSNGDKHQIPAWLVPDNIHELVTNNIIKKLSENKLSYMIYDLTGLPKNITGNPKVLEAVLQNMKKNPPGYDYWDQIVTVFPEVLADPDIEEMKNTSMILNNGIQGVDYLSLKSENQKSAYVSKAISQLHSSPKIWQYIHESLKTNSKILKAAMEGIKYFAKYHGYVNVPYGLEELPEFAPFLKQLSIVRIETNVLETKYEQIVNEPELKEVYINKICKDYLSMSAKDYWHYIPKEIQSNDNILKSLLNGLAKDIENENNVNDFMTMPFVQNNKKLLNNSILENGSINVDFDNLDASQKITYIDNACDYYIPQNVKTGWPRLNPAALDNEKVRKKLVDYYLGLILSYGRREIPAIMKHDKMKPYHEDINNSLISSGSIYGIFTEALSEDKKQKYKENLISHLKYQPGIYTGLDDAMKNDENIIKETINGMNQKVQNGYYEDAKLIVNEMFKIPDFKHKNIIEEALYPVWESLLKTKNATFIIRNTSMYFIQSHFDKILDKYAKGDFGGLYQYGVEGRTDEISSYLELNFKTEIDKETRNKIEKAVENGMKVESARTYLSYPSHFKELSKEEKDALIDHVTQVYVNSIESTPYIDSALNYYSRFKSYFAEEYPNSFIKIKDVFREKVKLILGKATGYDKEYYKNMVLNHDKSDSFLFELVKPKPEECMNEVMALANNFGLSEAATKWKQYDNLYPNNTMILEVKNKLVSLFVDKITKILSLPNKKSWCSIAFSFFPDEPSLQEACSPKPKPKPAPIILENLPDGTEIDIGKEYSIPKIISPLLNNQKTKAPIKAPSFINPGLSTKKKKYDKFFDISTDEKSNNYNQKPLK